MADPFSFFMLLAVGEQAPDPRDVPQLRRARAFVRERVREDANRTKCIGLSELQASAPRGSHDEIVDFFPITRGRPIPHISAPRRVWLRSRVHPDSGRNGLPSRCCHVPDSTSEEPPARKLARRWCSTRESVTRFESSPLMRWDGLIFTTAC